MGIKVLSLFDGMSCGQIALQESGIDVETYYASEIDKFAVKTSQRKFPNTIHLGSVLDVKGADLPKINLLIGGSPCQGFSTSGKGLNFEDPRSKLLFEYVRILDELKKINPDLIWLLENVRMKKEWEDTISRILGIQPININSARVSAQNRERLYWTNIQTAQRGLFDDNYCAIPQPKDRKIFLKDVLQPTSEVDEKYYISEKALARIMRKTYSEPQIDPEKTGTMDTKNNSGQLSVNSGTTSIREPRQFDSNPTLISERGKSHSLQVENSGKVPSLTSLPGCEHDNRVFVTNDHGEWRETDKALCVDANYFKGSDNHGQRTMVREPGIQIIDGKGNRKPNTDKSSTFTAGGNSCGNHSDMDLIVVHSTMPRSSKSGNGGTGPLSRDDGKTYCCDVQMKQVIQINPSTESGGERTHLVKVPQGDRIYDIEDKSVTPCARDGGLGAGTGIYNVRERIRRLTPIEVCRLQTVPDDYFFDEEGKQFMSDSQIYKMCGNGWTVAVIAHIFSFLPAAWKSKINVPDDKRSVATGAQ